MSQSKEIKQNGKHRNTLTPVSPQYLATMTEVLFLEGTFLRYLFFFYVWAYSPGAKLTGTKS